MLSRRDVSVVILTKNSEKFLEKLLTALKIFPEVLILDNGSTDSTLSIASAFENVTVHTSPFIGFGPLHNLAASKAKNDWILSIDSDEIPSTALIDEISNLQLDPKCIYSLPRHNFYRGKWIQYCGWYPERTSRLYNRQTTAFSNVQVHEKVLSNGLRTVKLNNPLLHTPYSSLSDFLAKMQHYSTLFANQNHLKKNSSPLKAITHGLFAFFKSYFLKKGFLGGYEGFLISAYNGHTAFYKYLKLYELNNQK